MDPVWGIQWIETTAGNRDFQPCPGIRGAASGMYIAPHISGPRLSGSQVTHPIVCRVGSKILQ